MEVEEKNIIFLIGNGYDLGHGLKTSYKDFIIWYLKDSLKKALESGENINSDDCMTIIAGRHFAHPDKHEECLYRLENEFQNNRLNGFINGSQNQAVEPNGIVIRSEYNFVKSILTDCTKREWNGIENEIYKVIKAEHHNIKISCNNSDPRSSSSYSKNLEIIKSLNKSVKCLKTKLKEYLESQDSLQIDRSDWFNQIMDRSINDDKKTNYLFLNFNYTTYYYETIETLKSRYGNKNTTFELLNIHGTLKSSPEEIVFGIGDEQNDFYHEIESLYGDEWLQCMKSFHYFRNDNYQNLLGFLAKGDFEIYVMGHSCSITDRTLLNMIFEHDHCKKIHIYHYSGMESYLKTAYNIARNFQDKVKMREVVMPFNEYLKM